MRSFARRCSALVGATAIVVSTVAAAVSVPAPGGTAVEAAPASGILQLVGHGNGHGVGLSQWGAFGYAVDHGWSAAQILDHYYGGTVAGTVSLDASVKVRLTALDDQQTAVVHDRGRVFVDGVAGGPYASVVVRELAPSAYSVWARVDVRTCPTGSDPLTGWTLVASGLASVTLRTDAASTTSADYADLLGVCEPSGRVRSYRGAIRAINGTDGENRTVNELPVEQYMRPVVASEMSASWASAGGGRGAQALQAQAIAGRSYALADKRYSYAGTCDNVCQTYRGAAWRSGPNAAYQRVEQAATDSAVAATAGVVRRTGSSAGPIVTAMYSSSSGGWTADSTLGFGAVVDAGDAVASNPHHDWTASVTYGVIEQTWPAIGSFAELVVTQRSGHGDLGGRVLSLTVKGSAGSVTLTGDTFRRAVGLTSNWFAVAGSGGGTAAAPGGGTTSPSAPPAGADACEGRTPPPITAAAEPSPAARLQAIAPVRLVDTREGFGAAKRPLGRGCTLVVRPGVPVGSTAVAVNITTVETVSDGFVTAYPCGIDRPLTATVQPVTGLIVGGAAIVPLAADGSFCVFSNVPTEVVIDLFGVFSTEAPGRFEPLAPTRRYDSRTAGGRLPAGSVVRVPMRGPGAAGADATAVALTVHALDAAVGGFVTTWPCDVAQPFVSGANVMAGASITNHVEVSLSGAGEVCLFVSAPMHLVVDLSGWYGPSASTDFYAVSPFRVADTRYDQGWAGAARRNENRPIAIASAGQLAGEGRVRAVAAQITAVDALSAGYVTVHPCQAPVPDLSMLRFSTSRNVAVLITGVTDARGRWCVVANATTHVVVDVNGWFG